MSRGFWRGTGSHLHELQCVHITRFPAPNVPKLCPYRQAVFVQLSAREEIRNYNSLSDASAQLALRSALDEGGSDEPGRVNLEPAAINLQLTP